MRKKIFVVAIIGVVIFLLALPKLDLFSNGKGNELKQQSSAQAALPVAAKVIQPGRLDNKLIITGTIQANESLELKSETSGKITGIYFKEGKAVRKGELLVQINDEEIRAQLEKQKHNKKLNEDNEYRQRMLLEKEAISQEEYDNALNRLNTTMADIMLLEAQLAKTKVFAPFNGVIGLRYVSEGAYISASNPIATLYSLTPAKIDFAVPSRYSTQIKAGKKIFFTVESDKDKFEGVVYAVEPQIDQNTRTLSVRAIADNAGGQLLPGQFAKVELILESMPDALMVPSEAIVPELNGHKVFVFHAGKAEEVMVEIGLRTDREVEIVNGLQPNDTLITTGMLQLRTGMNVQLTELENLSLTDH